MNNTDLAENPGKCDEVWERIRPDLNPYPQVRAAREAAAAGGNDAAGQLLEFIKDELNDRCYYSALAKKAGCKSTARFLASIGCEEFQHAKRLRAAYFILTGERACPDTTGKPEIYCLSDGLRARYIAETNGAREYFAASERAVSADLRKLYMELSQDEEAHAQCILELLEGMQ